MPRDLWWASLNTSSPRYQDWRDILQTDRVPLLSPFSSRAKLGDETCDIYALDWQDLDEEQSGRLIEFLAAKFKADPELITEDLERDGFMPILASDVTICYDMRAFL